MAETFTAEQFKIGQRVLFQPSYIGYGYLYGPDRGIPALLLGFYGDEWASISFTSKDGTEIPPRRVKVKNLRPIDWTRWER